MMYKKLKILTIVGTRPEIIRLSRIIPKLDIYCDHTLVHTGQNYDYELNEIFFKDLKIRKPDYFLNASKVSASQTIGNIINKVDKLLNKLLPDALLILGDTNSSLSAIAAKRNKIPIFHMEAGNRCFDMRVPEEINRKIVDHIADINLTYSDISREYLLNEGLAPDKIIKTGSPMKEVIDYYMPKIKKSKILNFLKLKSNNFYLVSFHREENVESNDNFLKGIEIINFIAESYKKRVILSAHPRTKKRIDLFKIKLNKNVKVIKPLCFTDYNKLQINAKAVLSDSGTITEESSIMNFPALNIRETHERPEGMEEGSVMLVGLSLNKVMQSLDILNSQGSGDSRDLNIVRDYNVVNVSDKVLRIINSYTDYVNSYTWKK